jgi:hypothetical protein
MHLVLMEAHLPSAVLLQWFPAAQHARGTMNRPSICRCAYVLEVTATGEMVLWPRCPLPHLKLSAALRRLGM